MMDQPACLPGLVLVVVLGHVLRVLQGWASHAMCAIKRTYPSSGGASTTM